jgi:hypothetical protein
VGYQFNSLKNLIAGKVSIASLVVTPLVVSGLALVGFQTYSLVTGKSFKVINFEIGKLWEQVSKNKVDTPIEELEFIRFVPPKVNEVLPAIYPQIISLRKVDIPEIEPKNASLVKPNRYDQNFVRQFDKLDGLLTQISDIDIPTVVQNPFLTKYYNRLSSDYLINPNISPNQGKWYVGFGFSPTLNYRSFSYDPSYVNGVAVAGNFRYTFGLTENQRNTSDKAVTSYNIGVDFGRYISSKARIYSGLHYASYGEQVMVTDADKTNLNYPNAEFMGQSPIYEVFNEENPSKNIPYTNRYAYYEIPLGLSVDCIQFEKSKISVDAGISFQKLSEVNALVYDFETDYYYWITQQNKIFRKFNLGGSLGITASQFVAERLELFINPHFKMNINSTFQKPYPVNQNQYATGLRIGFKQHLF